MVHSIMNYINKCQRDINKLRYGKKEVSHTFCVSAIPISRDQGDPNGR